MSIVRVSYTFLFKTKARTFALLIFHKSQGEDRVLFRRASRTMVLPVMS